MTQYFLSIQEKACLLTRESSHDSDSLIHYRYLLDFLVGRSEVRGGMLLGPRLDLDHRLDRGPHRGRDARRRSRGTLLGRRRRSRVPRRGRRLSTTIIFRRGLCIVDPFLLHQEKFVVCIFGKKRYDRLTRIKFKKFPPLPIVAFDFKAYLLLHLLPQHLQVVAPLRRGKVLDHHRSCKTNS